MKARDGKPQKKGLIVSGKAGIIPDMNDKNKALQAYTEQILSRIYGNGRGKAFTPKDFLDIANHETVWKSLTRLVKDGKIRRLARGIYDYPRFSTMLHAPAGADPDAIARAMARAYGWTILPTGDTALNLLGLSTQVPAQWQYFSDGPSKTYQWSGGTLAFKHRANKETTVLSPRTALIVQALKALGESRVDDATLATLRTKLDAKELARAVREARYATSWVYEIIKRLAAEEKVRHA